jgi:UDP-N-acetylglucosamine--N-acetylmuramyl-(pentapeptide) pyrophosphoryl-undecaprenol N-acetylglucosamine transferase
MGLDPVKKTILLVGGSLGARSMNESMINSLQQIAANPDVQFVWQTGKYYYNEIVARVKDAGKPDNLTITDFVSDMASALGVADLVISRAGAGSISEFALLGKAVILVPSPNVAEDHQTKNAMALVKNDAAIFVSDSDAKEKLVATALATVGDEEKLAALAENIGKMAKPKAAEEIAEAVISLAEAYAEKETRRKKENLK